VEKIEGLVNEAPEKILYYPKAMEHKSYR